MARKRCCAKLRIVVNVSEFEIKTQRASHFLRADCRHSVYKNSCAVPIGDVEFGLPASVARSQRLVSLVFSRLNEESGKFKHLPQLLITHALRKTEQMRQWCTKWCICRMRI